ncbi:MAG TPA: hypothetical protein DCG14_11095 [Phycisphaerales bacterium]|nr:hypothetical protein [Phycisphaerales bacterium]
MSSAFAATAFLRFRRLVVTLFAAGLASGCTTSGPDRLEFQSDRYDQAFDAAGEAVRKEGMPPVLTDRTGGVIEARPRLAGSVLEPWRIDNSDFEQWGANTLNKQRRRVRFEFLPVDFVPPEPQGGEALTGPPLPGSTEGELRLTDLETFDGRVELRVWVYVEREHRTGLRRGTWSRVGRTYATNPMETISPDDGTTRSPGLWTPVGRDEAMERRLLAEVKATMGDA